MDLRPPTPLTLAKCVNTIAIDRLLVRVSIYSMILNGGAIFRLSFAGWVKKQDTLLSNYFA